MRFKRPQVRYANTPQPATPYQSAAQAWDERIGSARAQAKNWRLMAFGCLTLAVLMAGVGGTHGDPDSEEGQKGGDEVGAGVHRLRHEAEAARREAGAELEPDERERGEDRPERSFPLGLHARKRT